MAPYLYKIEPDLEKKIYFSTKKKKNFSIKILIQGGSQQWSSLLQINFSIFARQLGIETRFLFQLLETKAHRSLCQLTWKKGGWFSRPLPPTPPSSSGQALLTPKVGADTAALTMSFGKPKRKCWMMFGWGVCEKLWIGIFSSFMSPLDKGEGVH
jgi:hypothetical protein